MQKAIIVPIFFLLAGIVFGANLGKEDSKNLDSNLISHKVIIKGQQKSRSISKAEKEQTDGLQSVLNGISDFLPHIHFPVFWP